MEAIIKFKNGKTITAEVNGNTYITNEPQIFPDDLSRVIVRTGDQETILEYVMIEEAASVDGRFWFCMVEEDPRDRELREQAEKILFLEDCLMEMSEEVYK